MLPRPINGRQEARRQALRKWAFPDGHGTSFLVINFMYANYLEDIQPVAALGRSVSLVLLACGIFYVLFCSGFDLRCADASLRLP